jgi:hypothetical protein
MEWKISSKVKEATEPVSKKLDDMKHALVDQTSTTNSLLAALASSQIRTIKRDMCKETGAEELGRLQEELDNAASDYFRYTKREYPVATLKCGKE